MTPAVRQTRTHIAELLARRGLNPRHDLGQNFLIDLNLLEFLVAQAELGPEDVVLEVGSGTGGLTSLLAEQAGAVIAVEVDPRIRALATEAINGCANVTLVGCDVLKNKNHFAEPVLAALDAALATGSRRLKLVANLPYCVGTPVISNLVATSYSWERMVVTIQLELAQRMTAKEGTANYGALSAWLQAQCRIEVLKRLPPDVFWPRPNVESAMIRIDPDTSLAGAILDRRFLHDFLRDVFQQRRKQLPNVLMGMFGKRGRTLSQAAPKGKSRPEQPIQLNRAQIEDLLRSQSIAEHARAEELSPAALVSLSNAVFETVRQSRGEDLPSSAAG